MKEEEYHNHSGGAIGSDTQWDIIGREYGVINHHHYWYGKMNPRSEEKDKISFDEFFEGKEKVLIANKTLKRNPDKYMNLLARNWLQVKNSDAIYGIGTLKSLKEANGGTGWAIQMAIDNNKQVYFFDQERIQWVEYDYGKQKFVKTLTPTLTKNFAGIGTRNINENGIKAIRNVYIKTFSNIFNK